jgi:hypothetical protein
MSSSSPLTTGSLCVRVRLVFAGTTTIAREKVDYRTTRKTFTCKTYGLVQWHYVPLRSANLDLGGEYRIFDRVLESSPLPLHGRLVLVCEQPMKHMMDMVSWALVDRPEKTYACTDRLQFSGGSFDKSLIDTVGLLA